jgi:hypothetical protein
MEETQRKINRILKIIASAKNPVGSKEIARQLAEYGMETTERTVRHYLQQMTEQGLLKSFWKEGRLITEKGRQELENQMVQDKIGLVSSKIEALSYLMDYDLNNKKGSVILNLSYFHKNEFPKALHIMKEVFAKKLGLGTRVLKVESGQEIGGSIVGKGKIAFGTLCTINLNGLMLKQGIPMLSRFGGVLQMENYMPLRFTELVEYSGSTVDPHEIFIRSQMTSVREAAKGNGKILAGLREVPAVSKHKAEEILSLADKAGFGSALYIGKPGQSVLGMPVGIDRVGIVIPGGLNPVAACEEWGLETQSHALSVLVDYDRLQEFGSL